MLLEQPLARVYIPGESTGGRHTESTASWDFDKVSIMTHPYPRSPNPATRSYEPAPVSSVASPKVPPAPPPSQHFLPSLVSSAPRSTPNAPQPIGIPPLGQISQGGFQPYNTPVTASSTMGKDSIPSTDSVSGTPGPSSMSMGGPHGQPQKRAYRQRRKDPSCDACRERKVKCDATETTSCSECASRNVKCQFTKETNRRMSSIKQVQDLEKQMDRLRRENISLRRMLSDRGGHADVDMEGLEHMPLHLPEVGSEPRRRHRHSPLPELERAREKARIFGKGIWKPPAPYGLSSQRTLVPSAVPDLPPKSTTDHLLHFYYKSVHSTTPMLHWPTFQRDVDDLYRHQQPLGPSWLSMFFAVLALGSLFSQDEPRNRTHQAVKLIEISRGFVDPWNNDYTLDDVRAMILTAMLLNELNLRSASWAWVGSAARVAQDLGLHLESGPWTVMEAEMRRRVWWTIYILDRSLSLELGRPMLIDDADCEALLPAAVDDHFIHEGDVVVPAGVEPLSHFLLAIINVVRSYPALIRAMATPAIAPTSLSTFDQHFDECRREFPPACDPSSDAPLPAQCFIPLTYLLHARLVLHRHNLSPACPTDVRVGAIDQCTHTALETASLLMRTPTVLATTATALVTTHVFRCTLFLLLAGYLEQAINCIRVLSHIGENRDVATACGSFLSFFVYELERKRHDYQVYTAHGLTGTPPQPFAPPPPPSSATSAGSRASREGAPSLLDTLLRDEEMIAYVSSDLQANPDAAWLWAGAERDVIRSPPASAGSHRQASPTAGRGSPSGGAGGGGSSLLNAERRMGLSVEAARQWQGWERLEAAVRALVASETTTPTSAGWNVPTTSAGGPTSQPPPPPVKMEGIRHSSIDRVGGPSAAPPRVGAGDDSTGSSPTGGGGGGGGSRARSKEGRISIADIM